MNEPHLNPQHFLGAIVLQAHDAGSNRVTTWNVIDGQQRLTNLQLLRDATRAVLNRAESSSIHRQLESLTHNSTNSVTEGESRRTVRHLNNDHATFEQETNAD